MKCRFGKELPDRGVCPFCNAGPADACRGPQAASDYRRLALQMAAQQVDQRTRSIVESDRPLSDATLAANEIERLREYACHKIGCAALHQMGAKCDCGLSELVGPREVSKP